MVAVEGTGFVGSLIVTVGSETCAAMEVLSETTLSCTTPPGEQGKAALEVTRPADGAVAVASFTYEKGGGTTPTDDTGDTGDDTGTPGTAIPVDYCHVHWPCELSGSAGGTSDPVYVWVFDKGVTEGKGAGAGLEVEVGWGGDGSDPSAGGWTWTDASFNQDYPGKDPHTLANDEWSGTFALPGKAGTYDFAGRVTIDGGVSWLYCDLGYQCDGGVGSNDGYSNATAGSLTVN